MEPCPTYEPWHDKKTGCTFIRRDRGKCLHYYFYFIDEMLGLCFLSVPTWCPFRALFYLNGHNWLASKLRSANIPYELQDNAFAAIEDWPVTPEVADVSACRQRRRRHSRTCSVSGIDVSRCSGNAIGFVNRSVLPSKLHPPSLQREPFSIGCPARARSAFAVASRSTR